MNFTINTDFSNLTKLPLSLWILLAVVLFTQAVWLFQDSSKRKGKKWLWGIWGLIQAPTPLLVYLLVVRKILTRNNKEKRMRNIFICLWIVAAVAAVGAAIIFHD